MTIDGVKVEKGALLLHVDLAKPGEDCSVCKVMAGKWEEGRMTKVSKSQYAGSDWLVKDLLHAQPHKKPSEFGLRVADLLGDLYQGLYHLSEKTLKLVEWEHLNYVTLCVPDELATFDGDRLTNLVILAHDYHIRVAVSGASNKYLRLTFHNRQRKGGFTERHPEIEEAVRLCRLRLGRHGEEVTCQTERSS
jgi:hypothetical protein